jgi:hypothetical protein
MKARAFPVAARLMPLLQKGMKSQWRVPISNKVAQFGSAPDDYWGHGDFGLARPDGFCSEFPGEFLRVPCQHVPGQCRRCDDMHWPDTSHRLYPRTLRDQVFWVQEAWGYWEGAPLAAHRFVANPVSGDPAVWSIDFNGGHGPFVKKWRPAPQMPRWASRYTMRVTSIRVERVQEITEDDARAEGMIPYRGGWVCGLPWEGTIPSTALDAFRWDWEGRHGPRAWRSNPWVIRMACDVWVGNVGRVTTLSPGSPVGE